MNIFRIAFWCIIVLFSNSIFAQENLIPNPGFEEYYDCDYALITDVIDDVIPDWKALKTTPRYFNQNCVDDALSDYSEMPHLPYDGNAFLSMALVVNILSDIDGGQRRNYSQVILKEKLVKGEAYYLSYFIQPTFEDDHPISHYGIDFSDTLILNDVALGIPFEPILKQPFLEVDSIHGKRNEWTEITHCFVPDQDYTVMTVGNYEKIENVLNLEDGLDDVKSISHDNFFLGQVSDSLVIYNEHLTDTICAGDCVSLYSNHSNISIGSFEWLLPGSDLLSSSESEVTVCYPLSGEYDVSLQASHCFGEYSALLEKMIVVIENIPEIAETESELLVLSGDSVVLEACHIVEDREMVWEGDYEIGCDDCTELPLYNIKEDGVMRFIIGSDTNCPDTCLYDIKVFNKVSLLLDLNAYSICEGDCFESSNILEESLSYSYRIDDGPYMFMDGPRICGLDASVYDLTIKATNGLSSDSIIFKSVEVLPYPVASSGVLSLMGSYNEPLLLESIYDAEDYSWQTNDANLIEIECDTCASTTIIPLVSTELILRAQNGECLAEALYSIELPERKADIYIPNIIDANARLSVDKVFKIGGEFVVVSEMQVYDRWGGLVFQSYHNDGWNGSEVEQGVYTYKIRYYDMLSQIEEVKIGDITILR